MRVKQFHLGCQTITWDNERVEKRDYTVQAVAKAGYEGVEIGARFLDLTQPDQFRKQLEKNGIALISIHVGWNPFLDKGGSVDKGRGEVEQAIAFARETKTPFLVMSGNPDQDVKDIAGLNEIGLACQEAGMSFCYHNHWWELASDCYLLKAIVNHTDPALVGFCPDIGWVRKVTPDVEAVLDIMAPRIRMAHFKDWVAGGIDPMDNETEFGDGILDFEAAFRYLRRLPQDEMWVVAEQWKSSANHLSPESCIKRNYDFLSRFVG